MKESFVLNQNTRAHENLVWDMKVAISRFYTNNLSEEVKKGQREKVAQGWLPTKPPLGYKTIGEKGHKIHVIDEDTAPYIKRMFEWYVSGNHSVTSMTEKLNKKGLRTRSGKKIGRSKVHVLLTDPFYYGDFRWKGNVYRGKHEAIISKETWDKVQEGLQAKNTGPKRPRRQLFQGKVHCKHCGGLMTWYEQKGHVYGHCSYHGKSKHCKGKTCLRQDAVEEQVIEMIESLAPANDDVLKWIEDIIRSEYSEQAGRREKEIEAITRRLREVRDKKDRTLEAKILEKAPLEYCERKIAEYHSEEKALEDELSKITDKNNDYQNLALVVHELAYRASAIYKKAAPDEKRILFKELFDDLIQNRERIKPKFTEAAEYLHSWMPVLNSYYAEHKKMPKVKSFLAYSASVGSEMTEIGEVQNSKLRTAKNGSVKQQTAQYVDGLRPLLAWRDNLRTIKWQNVFLYPALSLHQMRLLLSL